MLRLKVPIIDCWKSRNDDDEEQTNNERLTPSTDEVEERAGKNYESDARRKHTEKGGNCILLKTYLGKAKGIVEKIERKKRDKAGKGNYLPSVFFHLFIQSSPTGTFQLPLHPFTGKAA